MGTTWGVVQSCSQDQDSDSLTMVGGKDRPVLKLKDMEEKHLHNLFLKNMSGLIEEVKNPTPRLNPNSKCGGMATHAGLALELGITRKKSLSPQMTTHAEADAEVAGLRERYTKVKATSDTWVKKLEVLVKEWVLLDNTVTELNSWVAKDKSAEGENQFSLEKMESTLGELKNIFKQKEKLVEGL